MTAEAAATATATAAVTLVTLEVRNAVVAAGAASGSVLSTRPDANESLVDDGDGLKDGEAAKNPDENPDADTDEGQDEEEKAGERAGDARESSTGDVT